MHCWTSTKPGHLVDRKSDVDDRISVLLPIYNVDFSLEECLKSILSQTHKLFEVVAVDDGSSDSSTAILSRFASLDSRIKPFYLNRNKGVVAALNFGLQKCKGKWVARMDADDLMHPHRLALQLDYLKNNCAFAEKPSQ